MGGRDDPGLQYLRPRQLQRGPAAAAADPSQQEAVVRPRPHRGEQTGPAAPPYCLQRGGTAARPVAALRLLRGVSGRDVPWRPAGVSPAGRPGPGDSGAEEDERWRPRDRQERVSCVRKETSRVEWVELQEGCSY